MNDDLTEIIRERAKQQLWRKLETAEVEDPNFAAEIRKVTAPWVRRRMAEGHGADDLDRIKEIADSDEVLTRRGAVLLAEHYPRLLKREISTVIDDMVSGGELLAEVGDDGETYYIRPEG